MGSCRATGRDVVAVVQTGHWDMQEWAHQDAQLAGEAVRKSRPQGGARSVCVGSGKGSGVTDRGGA